MRPRPRELKGGSIEKKERHDGSDEPGRRAEEKDERITCVIRTKQERSNVGNPIMNSKRMKNKRLFSALAVLLIAAAMTVGASAQIAADWFVDGSSGDDSDNGQFWSTAFKTVQKALAAAQPNSGEVIFVAAGTYYPDEINGGDSNDRDATFSLVNDVSVYGGFLNGDVFEDRDPEANITILIRGYRSKRRPGAVRE